MEDYKTKYEKAIEQAKKELQACGSLDCDAARQIFRFFPELKESEDERIRKVLIQHIKDKVSVISGWRKEELIAWLEKQKEQKPVNTIVEDLPNGEDYGIDSLWHAIQILERTLGEVEGYQSDDGILEHKCAIEAVKRLYKQKPAWSEEDERMCKNLLFLMEQENSISSWEGCYDWLKSLKERYTWKPSDEQMKQLGWVAVQNKDNMIGKELMSLYQDLKKLKEE